MMIDIGWLILCHIDWGCSVPTLARSIIKK
jgi:hypothetical protein